MTGFTSPTGPADPKVAVFRSAGACRHHQLQLGQTLELPDCTCYGHPYSVQRTQKNLAGEADGTRPRKLPAGRYVVRTTLCPMMRDRLWVLLDVEHSDGTWVTV